MDLYKPKRTFSLPFHLDRDYTPGIPATFRGFRQWNALRMNIMKPEWDTTLAE